MESTTVRQSLPILLPYEPKQFWEKVRQIIREEIKEFEQGEAFRGIAGVPGFPHKALYRKYCAAYGEIYFSVVLIILRIF